MLSLNRYKERVDSKDKFLISSKFNHATQMVEVFDFSKRLSPKRKEEFAKLLKRLSRQIGFKVSSRGWCYIMEQHGFINKNQFDKIDDAINDCRRKGLIPVDFVAEEDARLFKGVQPIDGGDKTMNDILEWMLRDALDGSKYFQPKWWESEKYYIQMVVEKIDLVTLFEPVCNKYKIPIANAKGWSSILQRAQYCRRYKEAEEMGLKCVLLYCGDHDPDGGRISDTLRANLEQISEIVWSDGGVGWHPDNLIIDRFGLNLDYIEDNNLTWIDNLITGSGKNLADEKHPNHELPYVQEYLQDIGERKCEANAIVVTPGPARQLCKEAIEKYLGPDATDRFAKTTEQMRKDYAETLRNSGVGEPIAKYLDVDIDDYNGENDTDEDTDEDVDDES